MSINELSAKVNELRELKRTADELAAEIETLQDSIKGHMSAAGLDTITGPNFKITWKTVSWSRFDVTAFKRENPGTASAYMVPTTSRRFVLI